MPDIAMCKQAACPMSAKCYRFTATPNQMRQTYFAPEYGEAGCSQYIPNRSAIYRAMLDAREEG